MSKIERFQGNLRAFASNAQGLERTLFGETAQANDLTSQVTDAFLRGWGIVGPSEHPSLEDFNAAMYAMSQFLAYQHQVGVPEWHADQEYYVGSVCTHGGVSYQSLVDDNTGNQPPSAEWTTILTAKNGDGYFQPKNGNLTALAGLNGVTNYLPYFTDAEKMTTTALTNLARQLIAQTDANGMIAKLGLTNTVDLAADALPKLGTAAAATKLATARTINGVAFDGTANITIGGGLGQTWSDVTASRALGTTYTNSTNNTIAVSAYTNALLAPALVQIFGNVSSATVNTMAVGGGSGDVSKIVSCFLLVPPGATYSISTNPSQVTIAKWSELR